jgi:hypothetical protein
VLALGVGGLDRGARPAHRESRCRGLVPRHIHVEVQAGLPEEPRRLLREYIDEGRLGVKSSRGYYEDYSG